MLNSLLLTGLLIFYSPNANVSLSEYLPRVRFGANINYQDIPKPKEMIIHYGNNTNVVVRENSNVFEMVNQEMGDWSFYEFSQITYKIPWKDLIENREGIEINFSTPLSNSLISSMYRVITTNPQIDQINRIWMAKGDDDIVKAYFISDTEDKVFVAYTSLSKDKIAALSSQAKDQTSYSYYWSYPINENKLINQVYYLPDDHLRLKVVKKSFTNTSIDDFIQMFFIDPSLVRKVDMNYKENKLFTDGNRSLQFFYKDNYIVYYHPISDYQGKSDMEKDISSAIRFVNQYGGWDDNYFLADINNSQNGTQTTLTFEQQLDGYPLFDQEGRYNNIQIQLTNGIVNSFQRSMIILDKRIESKDTAIMTKDKLLKELATRKIYLNTIKSIEIGYQSKQVQEYYLFEPYWKVDINGKDAPLFLPAYEKEVE